MRVTFLGAAGTVTGSRFLVEHGAADDRHRLLVDCGLFQGVKALRRRNWAGFPVEVPSIEAVVLTHAHLDHSGWLPRLVRAGFDGPVLCSEGTADLCQVLLRDSAHIHEEDARRAATAGSSRHDPPLPLYDIDDAEAALALVRPIAVDEPVEAVPGLEVRLTRAGHIIGATCASITDGHRRLAVSGDVGRPEDPLLRPPAPLPPCDRLLIESTYGNRHHPETDPLDAFGDVLRRTLQRGGVLIIPAFAVGRAQIVLHLLAEARRRGDLPAGVPVALDSPMALDATELFLRHAEDHRLSPDAVAAMFDGIDLVRDPQGSRALDERVEPRIIVSASGMATGGRVLHHLERFAGDRRCTVLFTGFQAPGTRGDAMVHGVDEIKVFGRYVPVRAEVVLLDGLSAHADRSELLRWLASSPGLAPEAVSVVHGEPAAADEVRRSIHDRFGWSTEVAVEGTTVDV